MFLVVLVFAVLIGQTLAWTQYPNQYPAAGLDPDQYQPSNDMLSSLQQNDLYLADIINDYVFYQLQRGQFSNPSGWGYPYSRGPVSDPAYNRGPPHWTPFEQFGSFYNHRNRFPHLSALARERLEMQGLQVRRLNMFDNDRGIYIKWDIADPGVPRFQNDRGKYGEEYWPSLDSEDEKVLYRKGTWCDKDPNTGMCRLEQFWNDPGKYLCRNGPMKGFC
jgi:hypothetical protein